MRRCKSCHGDRCRKRREDTPEKVRESQKTSKEKRIEHYRADSRERRRKWRRDNPQANQAQKREHRARIYGSGGRHTQAEWLALCEAFGHRCAACGLQKELTRDHVIPLTKGGSDGIANIQPLCGSCNSRKGARHSTRYGQSIEHSTENH